ncbi:hypothetical protein Tco_1157452, partial [Tanacetum coccineum]
MAVNSKQQWITVRNGGEYNRRWWLTVVNGGNGRNGRDVIERCNGSR